MQWINSFRKIKILLIAGAAIIAAVNLLAVRGIEFLATDGAHTVEHFLSWIRFSLLLGFPGFVIIIGPAVFPFACLLYCASSTGRAGSALVRPQVILANHSVSVAKSHEHAADAVAVANLNLRGFLLRLRFLRFLPPVFPAHHSAVYATAFCIAA